MAPPAKKESGFAALPLAGKLFILVVILGVVSAIYYFALHMQLTEDIQSAQNQYRTLQRDLQQAQQRQRDYLAAVQELATREPIDRANKRVLPESSEIPAFLQDLNRLAELSGLEIRLVEPQPERSESHYIRIPVKMSVTGRYHQLAKFFYNVSRLERAISMENIHLNLRSQNTGEEITLNVDVLATTYRRPAPSEGRSGGGRSSRGMGMSMGMGMGMSSMGME